jgi:hypothetical protein
MIDKPCDGGIRSIDLEVHIELEHCMVYALLWASRCQLQPQPPHLRWTSALTERI